MTSHLLMSTLARAESKLGRTELLELLRRLARCSQGSDGCSPVDLAKMFKTSVNDITPVSLPDRRAPAMADAGTAVVGTGDGGAIPVAGSPMLDLCAAISGVAGAEGDGEADSTTHMRCDVVATNFATVCASVE